MVRLFRTHLSATCFKHQINSYVLLNIGVWVLTVSTMPLPSGPSLTNCEVRSSMVTDIKKNHDKILCLKGEMHKMGMSRKAKGMKVGDDDTVEVHCCIVLLIRKELSEQITAEIHSVVQLNVFLLWSALRIPFLLSEMMNSMKRQCTGGSSTSERKAYLSQAQYCVKSCPAAQDVWVKSQVSFEE